MKNSQILSVLDFLIEQETQPAPRILSGIEMNRREASDLLNQDLIQRIGGNRYGLSPRGRQIANAKPTRILFGQKFQAA